ncbi:MAG: hypothetical protein KGL44_04370 [Sphingomonadales bacterium]|nr:hypothetical protein [Sphingomonadales bacterium]
MALIRPTSFWRQVNPRGAIADLVTVYQQAGRNRWRFAVAAAAMTVGIFSVMAHEEGRGLPRPPEVTYINSWPIDRSDAEIKASNLANQRYKERLAAEQAKRDEDVRQMYKSLGRATGIDVDAIEKQAAADRAAQAAAGKAAGDAPGAPQPAAPAQVEKAQGGGN